LFFAEESGEGVGVGDGVVGGDGVFEGGGSVEAAVDLAARGAEEIGEERATGGVEGANATYEGEEDFLGYVIGGLGASAHAEGVAVDGTFVELEDDSEGGFVTGAESRNQGCFVVVHVRSDVGCRSRGEKFQRIW